MSQRQAEASLEIPFQPKSPIRTGHVPGCGCAAGRVQGSVLPAQGQADSGRLCGEGGMCAAGAWLTLPNSQLCF